MDVACRLRRPGYAEIYPWEFTIRDHRDSGAMTEYAKVINGFADWLFYGHVAAGEACICRWLLVDLRAFRAHLILYADVIRKGTLRNADGTGFRWFDALSFPRTPRLLIASSHELPADSPPMVEPPDEVSRILGLS